MKMIKVILFTILLSIGLSYSYYSGNVHIENAAKVINSVNKNMTYPEAYHIAQNVYEMTTQTNLEYSYVLGVMMTESKFRPNVTSQCGAMGLMQVMPKTFTAISTEHSLNYTNGYDVESNIRVGILYLDKLFRKYGHIDLVSASYNGGPRAANNYRLGNYEDIPKETMNYIRAVKRNQKYFEIRFRFAI